MEHQARWRRPPRDLGKNAGETKRRPKLRCFSSAPHTDKSGTIFIVSKKCAAAKDQGQSFFAIVAATTVNRRDDIERCRAYHRVAVAGEAAIAEQVDGNVVAHRPIIK